MLIVLSHVIARPESFEDLLAISLEHVKRSRTEPGCLEHGVHCDAEDPLRLVFLEKWADEASLEAHFALEASQTFVREAVALAAETPVIEVYGGERIPLRGVG
ncbi:MAG: putative quinol monooxygenase [Acidobacteriota bacterium]